MIRITMPANRFPDGSAVSKAKGTKRYKLIRELFHGPDHKLPISKAPNTMYLASGTTISEIRSDMQLSRDFTTAIQACDFLREICGDAEEGG